MKTAILVKGWIDIYHSYALVNYFQLKYLSKQNEITTYFEETPYFSPSWVKSWSSGLTLNNYEGQSINAIYRISFPYVIEDTSCHQFLFYTSESRKFEPTHFNRSLEDIRDLVNLGKLTLITPSQESATAFTDHYISVEVIPHGYDPEIYFAQPEAGHNWRNRLSIPKAAKVYLNVSAMTGNKKIGIILAGFCQSEENCYLILKGNSSLYRSSDLLQNQIDIFIKNGILSPDLLKKASTRMRFVYDSLNFNEMRGLYNSCDAYVSAGINEGFDMPIIEAAACGKAVITNKLSPNKFIASETFLFPDELTQIMNRELAAATLPPDYNYQNIAKKIAELIISKRK